MLKIDVTGLDALQARLTDFALRLATATRSPEFLNPAGVLFSTAAKRRIAEGGLPPFKPLLAATIARRRDRSSQPLLDTGLGRRSISHQVSGGTFYLTLKAYMFAHHTGVRQTVSVEAHRRKVKSRDVRRGKAKSSGVGFVKAHSRRMNLPARPFLGILTESETSELRDILVRALLK